MDGVFEFRPSEPSGGQIHALPAISRDLGRGFSLNNDKNQDRDLPPSVRRMNSNPAPPRAACSSSVTLPGPGSRSFYADRNATANNAQHVRAVYAISGVGTLVLISNLKCGMPRFGGGASAAQMQIRQAPWDLKGGCKES